MTGIFKGLQEYASKQYLSMHMPGHKSGKLIPEELVEALGSKMFTFDLTELPETDNLQAPSAMILETEKRIAAINKAEQAFLLVNGSTAGLLAAIYALAKNKEIFIASNCHQAVYHAIILSGAEPIFIAADYDDQTGAQLGINPDNLTEAIYRYPSSKVLVVTYPNYYGQRYKMEEIIRTAKNHGLTVIVDEAHGAHFPFMQELLPGAISLGADVSIQSWHKMLPVLNQGSVLLTGKKCRDHNFRKAINLFQTTSPSYLIMATIDAAANMYCNKAAELKQTAQRIATHKEKQTFTHMVLHKESINQSDPFKLWLTSDRKLKTNAEKIIRDTHRIEPEILSDYELLFLLPLDCSNEMLDYLFAALYELDEALSTIKPSLKMPAEAITEPIRKPLLKPSELDLLSSQKVAVEEAQGKISAQIVAKYPPGIPLVYPGDTLTKEIVCYLSRHKINYSLQDGIEIM